MPYWMLEFKLKQEEELRLRKDVWMSIILLTSGLADKVGEQDKKLETETSLVAQWLRIHLPMQGTRI